jgi:hypothetical protein
MRKREREFVSRLRKIPEYNKMGEEGRKVINWLIEITI